jgi:hypothetical protein
MPVLNDKQKILEYDPNSIFKASKYISNISTANLENLSRNPDIVDKKNPDNVNLSYNVDEFLKSLSELQDNILLLRGYVDENELTWRGLNVNIPNRRRPNIPIKQKKITIPQGTVISGSGRKPKEIPRKQSLRSRLLKNNLGEADEENEREDAMEEKHSLLSLKEPPRFTKKFIQRPELSRKAMSADIKEDELNEGLTSHIAPFSRDYREKYIRKTYSIGDEDNPTIDERLIGGAGTDSDGSSDGSESDADSENTEEYYARQAREADENDLDREDDDDDDDPDLRIRNAEDNIAKHNPILHLLSKISTLLTNTTIIFNGKVKKNFNKIERLEVDDIDDALADTLDEWYNLDYSILIYKLVGGSDLYKAIDSKFDKLRITVLTAIKSYAPIRQGGGMHHYSGGTMMLTGFNKGQKNNPTKYLL